MSLIILGGGIITYSELQKRKNATFAEENEKKASDSGAEDEEEKPKYWNF